jgi:DNA topoisomerase I
VLAEGAAEVAPRRKKKLVIVESPAKAKTINKYLGPDYEVAASKGHVRDLPKSKFGIDIENGWKATYTNLTDRKAVLDDLKKQASKAELVYLAPDPDREGEAIAWHLKEALGLSDEQVRRVTFNEITKTAIQKAFANPGDINMDRVRAQETRRFLDRVVGYQLSPLLRKKVTRGLSAGRVQSVAVRLIAEREKEIQAFKAEEFWRILATLLPDNLAPKGLKIKTRTVLAKTKTEKPADGEAGEETEEDKIKAAKEKEKEQALPEGAFRAELAEWKGEKFAAKTQDEAEAVVNALKTADFIISKVEQKDRAEKPQPPFTTSTLQQQASLRLHFTAKRTMMVAQRLYEGVSLGSEGQIALITYMRTDSVRTSEDALKTCRDHIKTAYGDKYLPDGPNRYQSGKSAQEGHEAVRPTDVNYTPERVKDMLSPEHFKLYQLIWQRFVASQMKPAIFAITNVEVTGGDGLLKAQGKILKFDGYRKVYHHKDDDAVLPPLKEQQKLKCQELVGSQHFTQPPARFNEASLVKTLEKEGIGRPSTYASIIAKIQERGYVELKERRFFATQLGMMVTELLVEHFPKIMNVKFTSHMEDELDEIENAKIHWHSVLDEFYQPFAQSLKEAETKMPVLKGIETGEICAQCKAPLVMRWSKRGPFLGCSKYPECKYIKPREGEPERTVEMTEFTCPECGKQLVKRMGKKGPFFSCSGYPDCKTLMNIDPEGKPVEAVKKTKHTCSKCGKPMVIREGRRGPFLACSGYPACKNAMDVDAHGNPIKPVDTGVKCDKCGSPMAVRKGPRGPFMGCTAYPKCRNAKPLTEELKEKLKDVLPPPPPKLPAVEVDVPCPDCGGPMKVRQGRRGPFLGCAKYPKCKGTREAPPDLAQKLAEG